VLAKCSHSNSKCQLISRMEIAARSLCLLDDVGVLLVGGKNGVLYMLRWP